MKEQIWQSILSFAGEEEQEKERLTELLSEPTECRSGRKVRHLRRVGRLSVRAVAMALLAAFFVTAGPMKMVAEAGDYQDTIKASELDNGESINLTGNLTITMDVPLKNIGQVRLNGYTLTVKGNGSGQTLDASNGDSTTIRGGVPGEAVGTLAIEGATVTASFTGNLTSYCAVEVGTLTMGPGSELRATVVDAGENAAIFAQNRNGVTVIEPVNAQWVDSFLSTINDGVTRIARTAILRGPATSRKEAAQEAVQQQYIPPHVHEYVWETTKEPTEEEDGEECYICKGCGAVQYRIPLTGCGAFNINTMNRILNAKPGETLHISTTHWLSFHKMIGDALAKRPDVTLVVDFLSEGHKGDPMSFTIPAGAGGPALFNADGYAGFHYLAGLFATGQ